MKRYFVLLFCIYLFTTTFAQIQTIKIKKEKFVSATFPGGKDSIKKYLDKTIGAKLARRLRPREKVDFNAQVEISEKGKIIKVNLVKGSLRPYIDSMFISILEKMPAWIPATDQKGKDCKDMQFVSFEPDYFSFSMMTARSRPNRCYATKEDFTKATNIVGMVEDQLFVDSIKTGVVLCKIILADRQEYVDTKAVVVVQECNWNIKNLSNPNVITWIPGCYNCDMRVLTDRPSRFKDVNWEKNKNSGYKKFYLLDDRNSVINAVSH